MQLSPVAGVGVSPGFTEAIVLGAVLLAVGGARANLLPVPLGRWPELADRSP